MGKRINFKKILTKIGLCSILITFTQCASSQKVDDMAPIKFNNPYFQSWVSGIRGGGTGFIVYLPLDSDTDIQLEHAYFKGKKIALTRKRNEAVYVGRYTNPTTVRKDLVMSSDPKEEYNNKLPVIEEKIPFELKAGECMIEYSKNGKKVHFKLDELPEKKLKAFPMSAPPNRK